MNTNAIASRNTGKGESSSKWFFALAVAMLALLAAVTVIGSDYDSEAATKTSGGIQWDIDKNGKVLTITKAETPAGGYSQGVMPDYVISEGKTNAPWGTITTPGYKLDIKEEVTVIGSNAFYGSTGFTVTPEKDVLAIPATVTNVNESAFEGCTNIAGIRFEGESLPTLGTSAFELSTSEAKTYDVWSKGFANSTNFPPFNSTYWNYCLDYIQDGGIKWVNDTQNSVLRIIAADTGVMNDYDSIGPWGTITTGGYVLNIENVTKIGNNAFNGCTGLNNVYINTRTAPGLGTDVFKGCTLTIHVPFSGTGYEWTLPTTVTLSKDMIDVPGAAQGLVYNGTEHTGIPASETGEYSIQGDIKGTNAGAYTAKVDPTEGKIWMDTHTNEQREIVWSISAKKLTKSMFINDNPTYNGAAQTGYHLADASPCVITASDYTVTGDATGTEAKDNYVVKIAGKGNYMGTINNLTWTIAKKDITNAIIDLGDSLTYNGLEQTQTVTSVTIDGLAVTYDVSGNTGKDAGEHTLTVSGNGNFTGDATKVFTIGQKDVTVSEIAANDKPYDGKDVAELLYTSVRFEGKLDADALTVTADGKFDDANVGTGKTVTISNLVLGGASAGNYKLAATGQQETAKADITQREVTVSGITALSKQYDGNTTATLVFDNVIITEMVEGDSLTVTAIGTFDNENVGTGKTVTISNLALGGASAGNYILAATGQQSTTTADITSAALYVVTFSADGQVQTVQVADGSCVLRPSDPSKAGSMFVGWFRDSSLYDFATPVTCDITITAKFSPITEKAVTIDATGVDKVEVKPQVGVENIKIVFKDVTIEIDMTSMQNDRLLISATKQSSSEKYEVNILWETSQKPYEGKTTITFTYDSASGTPTVYYYPDDGSEKEKMDATINKESHTVTFVTTHNSVYGIEYVKDQLQTIDYVLIAALIIAGLAVLLYIAYAARKSATH